MLAASPAARQALVHGLSLFQLAAVRLLHSAASGSQTRKLLATFNADAAKVAVQLTRSSLQQAADKVGLARSTCCCRLHNTSTRPAGRPALCEATDARQHAS